MKYVVVIGSKPDTKLPVVETECVYTASGAVSRGLYYRKNFSSKISAIITYAVFKMRNDTVLDSVNEVNPDEIVLRCTENKFEDTSGFLDDFDDDSVIRVSRPQQFKIQKDILGFKIFIAIMQHSLGVKKRLHTLWYRIIVPRILLWRKPAPGCSTGLWTALYALTRHPDATIIMAGIGLQAGEHFYPDDRFDFSAVMGRIDTYFVTNLPKRIKDRLLTTEERMHEVGGISLWDGETVNV